MPTEYARALGARLRTVRNQQRLSLQGVETRSRGIWKAVVVGSYERGDRSVTVQRLAELADFYGVPVTELLPEAPSAAVIERAAHLVLDLERVARLSDDSAAPMVRFVAAIQAQRGDYNGRVLSIRRDDLRTLSVLLDRAPNEVVEELIGWGVVSADARRALD